MKLDRKLALKRWFSGLERYCVDEGGKHDSYAVRSAYFLGVQVALQVAQSLGPPPARETMTRPFWEGYGVAMARFQYVMEVLGDVPSESYRELFEPADDLMFSEDDLRREPKNHNPTLPEAYYDTKTFAGSVGWLIDPSQVSETQSREGGVSISRSQIEWRPGYDVHHPAEMFTWDRFQAARQTPFADLPEELVNRYGLLPDYPIYVIAHLEDSDRDLYIAPYPGDVHKPSDWINAMKAGGVTITGDDGSANGE
jgi:hypothetical protein